MIIIRRIGDALRHHFSSLASLVTRGLGVGLGFVITLLLARWYGPEANGQYAIVTQTAIFLSLVAVGGLDLAITREFSKAVHLGVRISRTALLRIFGQTMGVALVIGLLLILSGDPLLALLGLESPPAYAAEMICLIMLARAFGRICGAMLRSQGDFVVGQAMDVLMIPLFTIILLMLTGVRTVTEILWVTAASGAFATLLGLTLCLRHTNNAPDALQVSGRAVYATALPIWGVAISANLADWYGLATVSAINGVHDAGLYRVAYQLAGLFQILTIGLFGTFSAQISAASHADDSERVARLARSAMRLSMVVVLPFALSAMLFAEQLLQLVGPEFAVATPLLRVLLAGQAVFAVTAISGLVLALSGWPMVNFVLSLITTVVILLGAPWAAQWWGIFGVGVFITATVSARYLAEMLMVRRLAKIDVFFGSVIVPDKPV